MITNFVAVRDNGIAFTCKVQKPNGLFDVIPWESLFCEYGLVIPTNVKALSLLDYFETGVYSAETHEGGLIGCLFTPTGKLYEYYQTIDHGFRRLRIPVGTGARHCRSLEYDVESLVMAGSYIHKTLQETVDSVCDFLISQSGRYMVFTVQQLREQLAARGITQEPPTTHFIGKEDEALGRTGRQYGGNV